MPFTLRQGCSIVDTQLLDLFFLCVNKDVHRLMSSMGSLKSILDNWVSMPLASCAILSILCI